ncbi:tetraprenyl-beta-curcumene synthase family protein [Bacillus sp. SD088]|uniref:tetraprenyl-beta-curcumene synthase family protein n=1 Tax=Bacillus sp. SD088 TaxID=2782012 RepID=UPI001A973B0D|nr:tetraprenyl-beta-curcumene synthase family protein [Bacillus sp. SD088]MBO0992453.1 tetraprenyl-beta-curcumene synthase family protein [Bacillus sp. SD088]
MTLPVNPVTLLNQVFRQVFPITHQELKAWKNRAEMIPNGELRNQALASIEHKTFHCEGGSIMALTALDKKETAIQFIVAYQTISDYLDNLCDRSTSLDPDDFAALHESMIDALTVGAEPRDYYRHREDQNDGDYLIALVRACQSMLEKLPYYEEIKPYLIELCNYYCDLQVHKHVDVEEREQRLQKWFAQHQAECPDMSWYEFSACTGSTLGIFCLVSYGLRADFQAKHAEMIRNGYFPYIQGLHILLDYFIDQEEDREEGDLNFCFYYANDEQLFLRLIHFLRKADEHTKFLPDTKFHKLINRGLLAIYLSDQKVNKQKKVRPLARKIMKQSGPTGYFFYWNGRIYRHLKGAN